MSCEPVDCGQNPLWTSQYWRSAKPTCRMLLAHLARREAARADWMAGNNSAMRVPMMAITTNSSTNVKPRRAFISASSDSKKPIPQGASARSNVLVALAGSPVLASRARRLRAEFQRKGERKPVHCAKGLIVGARPREELVAGPERNARRKRQLAAHAQ